MVRIRLRKIGSKGRAVYKIVVADQRKPQSGKYLEEVGTYDPHTSPATVNIFEDSEKYTLSLEDTFEDKDGDSLIYMFENQAKSETLKTLENESIATLNIIGIKLLS